MPVPHGPGLEVCGVPVDPGQLIGLGCLLMCVGGIKQKRDSLVHSLHSAPTCQLGTPVQLRNPLIELVQVALREQCISAGVHIHIYASPPQDRLRPDCPTCPAKGPDCGS